MTSAWEGAKIKVYLMWWSMGITSSSEKSHLTSPREKSLGVTGCSPGWIFWKGFGHTSQLHSTSPYASKSCLPLPEAPISSLAFLLLSWHMKGWFSLILNQDFPENVFLCHGYSPPPSCPSRITIRVLLGGDTLSVCLQQHGPTSHPNPVSRCLLFPPASFQSRQQQSYLHQFKLIFQLSYCITSTPFPRMFNLLLLFYVCFLKDLILPDKIQFLWTLAICCSFCLELVHPLL